MDYYRVNPKWSTNDFNARTVYLFKLTVGLLTKQKQQQLLSALSDDSFKPLTLDKIKEMLEEIPEDSRALIREEYAKYYDAIYLYKTLASKKIFEIKKSMKRGEKFMAKKRAKSKKPKGKKTKK